MCAHGVLFRVRWEAFFPMPWTHSRFQLWSHFSPEGNWPLLMHIMEGRTTPPDIPFQCHIPNQWVLSVTPLWIFPVVRMNINCSQSWTRVSHVPGECLTHQPPSFPLGKFSLNQYFHNNILLKKLCNRIKWCKKRFLRCSDSWIKTKSARSF